MLLFRESLNRAQVVINSTSATSSERASAKLHIAAHYQAALLLAKPIDEVNDYERLRINLKICEATNAHRAPTNHKKINAAMASSSSNVVGVHYRVGKKIGEGSFGVIFEGTNLLNNSQVAIKFVRTLKRFCAEAMLNV